VTSLEYYIIW